MPGASHGRGNPTTPPNLALLFSFELCLEDVVCNHGGLPREISLLFSFELCGEAIAPDRRVLGRWQLAIFFWIMLDIREVEGKVKEILGSSCYFLLNYACAREPHTVRRQARYLLFSFELCGKWKKGNNKKRGEQLAIFFWILFGYRLCWCFSGLHKPCYFLLNFVSRPKLFMLTPDSPIVLLFSFEFCLQNLCPVLVKVVYLLFSFEFCAWYIIKLAMSVGHFKDLLFSFEFCPDLPYLDEIAYALAKLPCYFLLNFV